MRTPSAVVVKVDRQGRLVLPLAMREELTTTPGEVTLTPTDGGVLISPVAEAGTVEVGDDGFPMLRLGRVITNDEVIAAIDADRKGR